MFSIIAPIYDPLDRFVPSGAIQRAMDSLLKLQGDFELIIVNNNPIVKCPHLTEHLRSLAALYPNKIRAVETNENKGSSGGFNAGMKAANIKSKYLVFMSADAEVVDPLMLVKIQSIFECDQNLGIAHPISVYEDIDEFNFSLKYDSNSVYKMIREGRSLESEELSAEEIQQVLNLVILRQGVTFPFPSTPLTFAVYLREMLKRIGSFDEGFLICHENNDISYRALLGGYKVARLDGIFVNHRRLIFRELVVSGTPERNTLPHSGASKQSTAHWNKKWGSPYFELYARWRWGKVLFALMLPYFWLRRFASMIKWGLAR